MAKKVIKVKNSEDFIAGVEFAASFILNKITTMHETERRTTNFNKIIDNEIGEHTHHYAARLLGRIKAMINRDFKDYGM